MQWQVPLSILSQLEALACEPRKFCNMMHASTRAFRLRNGLGSPDLRLHPLLTRVLTACMHVCVCVCCVCCVCVCVCARSQPWQKHKQEGLHRKRQEVVKRFDIDRQRQQVRVPARVVNVIFNLCACACAADVVRMSAYYSASLSREPRTRRRCSKQQLGHAPFLSMLISFCCVCANFTVV